MSEIFLFTLKTANSCNTGYLSYSKDNILKVFHDRIKGDSIPDLVFIDFGVKVICFLLGGFINDVTFFPLFRYDRDTSVFTPPKDSCMSVWITSLVQTREVIQMILDKYKVETESERFALFVVKETGGIFFYLQF